MTKNQTIDHLYDTIGFAGVDALVAEGMRGPWTWKLPPKMTSTPEGDRHGTVSPSVKMTWGFE